MFCRVTSEKGNKCAFSSVLDGLIIIAYISTLEIDRHSQREKLFLGFDRGHILFVKCLCIHTLNAQKSFGKLVHNFVHHIYAYIRFCVLLRIKMSGHFLACVSVNVFEKKCPFHYYQWMMGARALFLLPLDVRCCRDDRVKI